MGELGLALLCLAALGALAGAARLIFWVEPPPPELALPLVVIPVQVREQPRDGEPEVMPPQPPAPISLSKFRRLHGAPRAKRRRLHPPATLPRTGQSCEICKGVAVVWTNHEGRWSGVCRRCGLPFASVPHEGWQAPVPRPFPSIT